MVLPVSELDALFGARTAELVEGVVAPPRAAALRAALAPHWRRYGLVDRGSYDHVDDALAIAGIASMAADIAVAAARTKRELVVDGARALRLSAGDYLLAHHDRVYEGHPVEAVLDLSPAPIPAEIHYRRRGQVFHRVPTLPGALSLVERGPTVTCNHTYVSLRDPRAFAVRLVVLLRDAS